MIEFAIQIMGESGTFSDGTWGRVPQLHSAIDCGDGVLLYVHGLRWNLAMTRVTVICERLPVPKAGS